METRRENICKEKENEEDHFAAIESDRGGFAPRGFTCDGSEEQVEWLKSLTPIFKEYDLHIFEKGYGGVDIGPLKESYPDIQLFGFVQIQRHFDMHHSPNDVFENVNKRELELGAAAIASFIYILDQSILNGSALKSEDLQCKIAFSYNVPQGSRNQTLQLSCLPKSKSLNLKTGNVLKTSENVRYL